MSFTKSFLVECSRQNAENVKITQRNTGTENASWVNRQSFNFQVGDKVSTENIIIHSIGASADSTVELSGENEDSTGLVDNILGMEFSTYVCDNGYNSIHLPMFVPNTIGGSPYIGFVPDTNNGSTPIGAENTERDGQDLPGQATAVVVGFSVPLFNIEADYGSPICNDKSWVFKCKVLEDGNGNPKSNYVDGHLGGFPKVARTSFGLKLHENDENYNSSITGRKYTKLGTDYCGPYRRNTDTQENAEFFDTREDIAVFKTSIIVEIDAPIYESPSTICNKINETFHETLPLDEVPQTGVMPISVEGSILPHTAGPLNTVIRANGKPNITTTNYTQDRVYQNQVWGNIAVEDINKWTAIHAMMRCTLAFDGLIHYYGSIDQFYCPRPVICIDQMGYRQNFKFRHQDAVQQNQIKSFFPRKLFEFTTNCRDLTSNADHNNISTSIAYSIVPKYFVISTNIQYTSDNVARIKKWFDAMKQYQGKFSNLNDINADTQNWFVYSDIGSSMDGVNTKDEPANFTPAVNEEGEIYSYGKFSTDVPRQNRGDFYAPSTGLCSHIRRGRFNPRHAVAQANEYPYQQNYCGSVAMNPYSAHLKVGDTYDFSCSPRSDFPESGYEFYQYGEALSLGYPSISTTYKITGIPTDAPVRFKNNEQKDATMKLFANQLDDMTKMRFTNARGDSIANENGVEGFGEWQRNGTISSTDFDTSLSDGYGVYGFNIIDTSGTDKCCCFVVAEDSATFDGTNWTPTNPCALPNIYHGCPFGPSPSFMDSPAIFMINQQRNDGNSAQVTDEGQLQNYMMIGANDPTCQFDSALSRAKFFNFHTQRILGAREMPYEDDGQGNITISKATLGNYVIKIADDTMYYPNIQQWTETYNAVDPTLSTASWKNANPNIGLSTSVCGISIENIYSQPKGEIKLNIEDMTKLTEDTFYNSLLYKLGFTFKQFFPDFGLPYNWFDPAVQGKTDPINIYKSTKPLSTNASITISDSANLAIQDNTAVPEYATSAKDVPTYQLGFAGGTGVSLDGTASQAIIASNLPIKMDDAFYQIYSDIVPTTYKSENQDLNIIATCMKNYIEGDYIYGFASTYSTTVEFPLKISEITTEVRLPNGNLAPIDQKSSVIYKIERQMTMPDMNEIVLDLKKNDKQK